MNSPLLDVLEKLAARVKDGRVSEADAGAFVRRVIHSPAVALLVKVTPTSADDVVLEFLRAVLPPT